MSAIPAPLFALVGATDAVTAKARALPEKIAEIEIRRFERPSVDVASLDPRKVSMPKVELSKIELPKLDVSEVAGSAFELAAKAERAYEDFVTRGEEVVARVRGREENVTPVATPATVEAAAKKAEAPAAKKSPAPKPAAKKSDTPATDAE
jgi:hypothetical protein